MVEQQIFGKVEWGAQLWLERVLLEVMEEVLVVVDLAGAGAVLADILVLAVLAVMALLLLVVETSALVELVVAQVVEVVE